MLWLGAVNLAIAAFNLLPAYPLDGGRLVRALVCTGINGEVERADVERWIASYAYAGAGARA